MPHCVMSIFICVTGSVTLHTIRNSEGWVRKLVLKGRTQSDSRQRGGHQYKAFCNSTHLQSWAIIHMGIAPARTPIFTGKNTSR